MEKNIITITGYSCSGKSTLINEIIKQYNFDVIRFGEIHKECVKNNGYLFAKDWIREKGFRSYENQLLLAFKKKILLLDSDSLESNNIINLEDLTKEKLEEMLKFSNKFSAYSVLKEGSIASYPTKEDLK